MILTETLSSRTSNMIRWSPKGRNVVLATVGSSSKSARHEHYQSRRTEEGHVKLLARRSRAHRLLSIWYESDRYASSSLAVAIVLRAHYIYQAYALLLHPRRSAPEPILMLSAYLSHLSRPRPICPSPISGSCSVPWSVLFCP